MRKCSCVKGLQLTLSVTCSDSITRPQERLAEHLFEFENGQWTIENIYFLLIKHENTQLAYRSSTHHLLEYTQ